MGAPGCPELAFWTASIDSVLIVLMHSVSSGSFAIPSSTYFLKDRYSEPDVYVVYHIAFMPP
jgi:hypothetical protein